MSYVNAIIITHPFSAKVLAFIFDINSIYFSFSGIVNILKMFGIWNNSNKIKRVAAGGINAGVAFTISYLFHETANHIHRVLDHVELG